MTIPLEPVTFEFFARYVLAGFIIFVLRNAYVVGERPKLAEIALDVALLGLLNQMVWQIALWLGGALGEVAVAASTAPEAILGWAPGPRALFFVEVLALPVVLGVLSGRALRAGWATGLYRRLAIPLTDPMPRAYDHVFLTRGTGFVIVTFKDGTKIRGYYGQQSRAGRDAGRSELYLQRLYTVDDQDQWKETVPRRAALISLADLRSIEFLEPER